MTTGTGRDLFGVLGHVHMDGAYKVHVTIGQHDFILALCDLVDVLVVGPAEDDIGWIALDGRIIKALIVQFCSSGTGGGLCRAGTHPRAGSNRWSTHCACKVDARRAEAHTAGTRRTTCFTKPTRRAAGATL